MYTAASAYDGTMTKFSKSSVKEGVFVESYGARFRCRNVLAYAVMTVHSLRDSAADEYIFSRAGVLASGDLCEQRPASG